MLNLLQSPFLLPFLDVAVGGWGRDAKDAGEAEVFISAKPSGSVSANWMRLGLALEFSSATGSRFMKDYAIADLESYAKVLIRTIKCLTEAAGPGNAEHRQEFR